MLFIYPKVALAFGFNLSPAAQVFAPLGDAADGCSLVPFVGPGHNFALMLYSPDPTQRILEILAHGGRAPMSEQSLCEVLSALPHPIRIELIGAFDEAAVGIDLLMLTPAITANTPALLYARMRRYERIALLLDPEGSYQETAPMVVHQLLEVVCALPPEIRIVLAGTYADAAIGFHEFFTTLRANPNAQQLREWSLRLEEIRRALATSLH